MSSQKEASGKNAELTEDELSDLLDSALKDFCNSNSVLKQDVTPSSSLQNNLPDNHESSSNVKPTVNEAPFNLNDENSPFKLFESDAELKQCWSKLIKSCNEEVQSDDTDFRDSLHNTLKIISDKARDIAGDENVLSEEEIAKTLANLAELHENGPQDEEADGNMEFNKIMPLMSNIMENLLSKDFLYPTLSELSQKYPDYLKENKDTLPNEEYIRYEKQFKIILEICKEFDSEKETESAEDKTARFNRILVLMQTMQSHGTPPSSLVSPNALNSETMGDLNMLNQIDDSKCCIM